MGVPSSQYDGHTPPSYLSLLLFLLTPGNATVSSCYTCRSTGSSKDSACEKGSTSMSKVPCVGPVNHGCVSSVAVTSAGTVWARSCCSKSTCLNTHTSIPGNSADIVSCFTDNCNTKDPRSGSGHYQLALLMVSFSALFSLWNIRNV